MHAWALNPGLGDGPHGRPKVDLVTLRTGDLLAAPGRTGGELEGSAHDRRRRVVTDPAHEQAEVAGASASPCAST